MYFTYFKCDKCDEYYHMYSVELDNEASCPECGNSVVGIPENLESQVPAAIKLDLADIDASFDTPDDFIDDWLYEIDDTPDYDDIAFQNACYNEYF